MQLRWNWKGGNGGGKRGAEMMHTQYICRKFSKNYNEWILKIAIEIKGRQVERLTWGRSGMTVVEGSCHRMRRKF